MYCALSLLGLVTGQVSNCLLVGFNFTKLFFVFFFFNDTATTEIYTLSLHDALPISLVVLAGSEYGTGSSRDWAAKGTALLGVKAVLARSYERIHRSNLIGMGRSEEHTSELQSH